MAVIYAVRTLPTWRLSWKWLSGIPPGLTDVPRSSIWNRVISPDVSYLYIETCSVTGTESRKTVFVWLEKDSIMKRVCIIRNIYYPPMPPVKRNAETLVAHGYEVDVICLRKKGQKSQEVINGVKLYRLPIEHHRHGVLRYIFEYSIFFCMTFCKLTWLHLRKRYQVIEVSGMPDFLVFSMVIPKLLGAALVFNLLDHTPQVFMEHFKLYPKHKIVRLLHWIEGICARWADHCFGTQFFTKDILEEHGVPATKISVIPNVPDEKFSSYNTPPDNHDGEFCLITHGSLLKKYGVHTLLKAVPLLAKDIPHLKVNIVGDGEYKPTLKQLTSTLKITDYVNFTGSVPQDKVPGYIAQADIGIITTLSMANPVLPIKLFEYLDLGKPIVAASIPAITAYFDNHSVMFFKPGDEHDLARCILELYRNPENRAALAASGSTAYQKYRWSVTKYEYLKVFEKLCLRKSKENSPDNSARP
jgi:glycosyltransferase involved in cell wall biosynthesis